MASTLWGSSIVKEASMRMNHKLFPCWSSLCSEPHPLLLEANDIRGRKLRSYPDCQWAVNCACSQRSRVSLYPFFLFNSKIWVIIKQNRNLEENMWKVFWLLGVVALNTYPPNKNNNIIITVPEVSVVVV